MSNLLVQKNNQILASKLKENPLDLLGIDLDNLKHGDAFLIKLPIKLKNHLHNLTQDYQNHESRLAQENEDDEPCFDKEGNILADSLAKNLRKKKMQENAESDQDHYGAQNNTMPVKNQEAPIIECGEITVKRGVLNEDNEVQQVIELLFHENQYAEPEPVESKASLSENQGQEGQESEQDENPDKLKKEAEKINKEIEAEDQKILKYNIHNDQLNHPVFGEEPLSLDPSRTTGSDAYLIKTKKREQKQQMKLIKRVKKTLRLKPYAVDGLEIMTKFKKARQTKNVQAHELLSDDENFYRATYSLVKEKNENSSDESAEEESSSQHSLEGKRFSMPTKELRSCIMNLFKEKDQWTWEELKNSHLKDQPEAPFKKQILDLCDQVQGSGKGNTAIFKLKEYLKAL